jgi:hypothetical protein
MALTPVVISTVTLPDGRQVCFRMASLPLPNFRIDLAQLLDTDGVLDVSLRTFGDGIHYIGITVLERLGDRVAGLVQKGGLGEFAYRGYGEALGTTVELTVGQVRAPVASRAGTLGLSLVTYVGLVLKERQKTATLFAQLTGSAAPQVSAAKDVDLSARLYGRPDTRSAIGSVRSTWNCNRTQAWPRAGIPGTIQRHGLGEATWSLSPLRLLVTWM